LGMKIVTTETMAELLARAAAAPRKRTNLNLHDQLSDPINRFLNAGLAGTYVQPHRHRAGKWELLNLLQGRLDIVTFTCDGKVENRFALGPEGPSLIEILGGEWHSFVFHPPAAVVLEVKPGPYEPQFDKEFAEWAPPEGDPAAALFLSWLENAVSGEVWSGNVEPAMGKAAAAAAEDG
jgi:cupin fold WbuC family metalloprotein